MREKKIAVIGVGGRTGTMFASELGKVSNVLGVGREIEKIKQKELFIQRKEEKPELFGGKVITDSQWPPSDFLPEIIFLTTKNPVKPVVKYYYQKLPARQSPEADRPMAGGKEKDTFPTLVLSQNGIACIKEAKQALKEVLGKEAENVRVIRLNLFNPIDRKEKENKVFIIYSLPIRIVFTKISGPGNLQDLTSLFKKADIIAKEFPPEKAKNMEFSKLFFNLIGIASATRGLSVKEGLKDLETFKEEIEVLKEYIRVVKASGRDFLNFPHFPVKLVTSLINILPIKFLLPFRGYLASIISKGREGKPKDLAEIKYYNGQVVRLGEKIGLPTSINQKVVKRALG